MNHGFLPPIVTSNDTNLGHKPNNATPFCRVGIILLRMQTPTAGLVFGKETSLLSKPSVVGADSEVAVMIVFRMRA